LRSWLKAHESTSMPPELRLSKSVPGSRVEGKECVRSDLGILGGKTSGYFLTSECSGYFRFISGNVLTSIIGSWSSGSQVIGISAGISISCRNSTSGLNSISGSTFIPRPRDRVTMAEAGPAPGHRISRHRIGFRGAGTESNSPDRSVRPTLRLGSGIPAPDQHTSANIT